ncbi:single-stranded DNA-binding protein [Limosilactobacillus equigenerosi]|uniref:Single-stranded DNA-binding protein n=1 Tax=Limosilactobacillus equigenerosi DSM 18793 = JCM 14505 TaxID=1423742 RepID=A0A0R1UPP2_9LACO|nr:single-stranded DNA-binding protein [Limosilactobacillus equigenerosi]KRL95190.1 Single-stranded DNA-binding protein [Limosilactobacillus equigenerosi DSM 18793 = JCM 14505]
MLNRVTLTGRLAADPELRYTNSGTARVNFRLAVDRQFRNQQTGEREADFITCQIWRKSAENFANFTHKGSLVGIDGRIQTSHYTGQDGKEVYRTDVVVENFALLEPRSSQPANGNSQSQPVSAPQNNQWGNYNQPAQNGTGDAFGGNSGMFNQQVDMDNLPFGNPTQAEQPQNNQTTLDDVPF